MDHLACQYDWTLTPDDRQACLIAVRTSARLPVDASNHLKALADFLKGFLRERFEAPKREVLQREMRRTAIRLAMTRMLDQAPRPLTGREKRCCCGSLRRMSLSELRRIVDQPRKLRQLRKQAIAEAARIKQHIEETSRKASEEFAYEIRTFQTAVNRLAKGLGRDLTKRERKVCISIPWQGRKSLTEDELLERFGRALKLDDTVMSKAREGTVTSEFNWRAQKD
jgi:hypothetical protein